MFLRLFHVCHVILNRRSALFVFFGTNAFHVKAENEKLIAADLRCRQNLKYENFTSSFGRLRQKLHQKSCRTCSTIVFPHSTNQIIHLWRCRGRCCRHFLNSLSYRVIAVKSHRFTRAKLKKYKCYWSLVFELFISYSLHIWCFAGSFTELDCEFRASFSPKQAAAVSQFSSFL